MNIWHPHYTFISRILPTKSIYLSIHMLSLCIEDLTSSVWSTYFCAVSTLLYCTYVNVVLRNINCLNCINKNLSYKMRTHNVEFVIGNGTRLSDCIRPISYIHWNVISKYKMVMGVGETEMKLMGSHRELKDETGFGFIVS